MISMPGKIMYRTMKRILLLLISTYLTIAIILANKMHSSFLCICKVIADIFQLPPSNLLNDSFSTADFNTPSNPHCSKQTVSTSVQTDEESKALENVREKNGNTDVIIYNLNSNQRLVITKVKRNQCESCKSTTEISTSDESEVITAPKVCLESSNDSNMSIESCVLDSKIRNGYSRSLTSSSENVTFHAFSDGSKRPLISIEDSDNENCHTKNNCQREPSETLKNSSLNSCNDKSSITVDFADFECLLDKFPDNTYTKYDGTAVNKQKTSSPFKKLSQSPKLPHSILNKLNDDHFQITDNKDAGVSDNWESKDYSSDFKRRLSLPVKLNSTKLSITNFKLVQKQLIEDALKNTSRHEKSLKEIKYPFSSEISLDFKPNDEVEDKGVFSCSSYESLPVSDHLRNAFENNTLLNLYSENSNCEDKPDFSDVDNLEGFNDFKTSPLVSNINNSNIASPTISKTGVTKEENFLNSEKLKDHSKQTDNSKDAESSNDKEDSQLPSEISLDMSVPDMCQLLDRLVSSEVKLKSDKFSSFCDDSRNRNNVLKYEPSGKKKQSEVTSDGLCHSTTEETESFDSFTLLFESENDGTNEMNQSPRLLKPMLSGACETTDVSRNTVINQTDNLKNKSDSENRYDLLKSKQHSYLTIAFIDDNLAHEACNTNQDISSTIYHGCSFSENKKMLEENMPTCIHTDKCVKNDDSLFPVQKQPRKTFPKLSKMNRVESIQSDLFESTSVSENIEPSFKYKEDTNKPNYDTLCQLVPTNEMDHAQKILCANCKKPHSALFEENASSGDSASDNSVVTVKDHVVAENQ